MYIKLYGRNVIGNEIFKEARVGIGLVERMSRGVSDFEFKYRAPPWWDMHHCVVFISLFVSEGLLIPSFFLLRNEEGSVRRPKFSC